jgi:hypothetical protein
MGLYFYDSVNIVDVVFQIESKLFCHFLLLCIFQVGTLEMYLNFIWQLKNVSFQIPKYYWQLHSTDHSTEINKWTVSRVLFFKEYPFLGKHKRQIMLILELFLFISFLKPSKDDHISLSLLNANFGLRNNTSWIIPNKDWLYNFDKIFELE